MTAPQPVDAILREEIDVLARRFGELPELIDQQYALLQLLRSMQKKLPPERFHELMVWLNGRAEMWMMSGIWLSPDP